MQHIVVPHGHCGHWVTVPLQLTCPLIPEAQFWFRNVQEPPLPPKLQLTLTPDVSLQVAVAEQVLSWMPWSWSGRSRLS
jgi:hypothetical protein